MSKKSKSIRKLSAHLIRHIAAGEVIDRPYSVVKELLENALDAGATRIEVELVDSGLTSIKVTDNGSGIAKDDLSLVFERYATSKLEKLEDLLQLLSFGFRGEALYSVAAVGEVVVQTKSDQDKVGSEITSIRGQVQPIQPVGHRQGTTIIVKNLFHHMPVRKGAVKPRAEVRQIIQLLKAYSLEFPQVSFQLTNKNAIIWSSFGEKKYLEKISQVLDIPLKHGIILSTKNPYVQVKGWISTPEHFVSNRKNIFCFINHRLIDNSTIFSAIMGGLQTFFHRGKFPQLHLSLDIPPEFVDVNLHPQKKWVKFLHADEILSAIQESITQAFQQTSPANIHYRGNLLFPETGVRESQALALQGRILQLNETYLLAPTNQGFLLIDQHAADERLWYNRLLARKSLLKKVEKKLNDETQQELADDEYLHSFEPNIDARVAIIACHSAIRAGQKLTQTEMKNLVEQLLAAGSEALVCPHGRPTYVSISLSQLARMFRR